MEDDDTENEEDVGNDIVRQIMILQLKDCAIKKLKTEIENG